MQYVQRVYRHIEEIGRLHWDTLTEPPSFYMDYAWLRSVEGMLTPHKLLPYRLVNLGRLAGHFSVLSRGGRVHLSLLQPSAAGSRLSYSHHAQQRTGVT